MATTQINLRLDDDLLAKVDAACGDVPRNRWITRVLEREVARADSNRRAHYVSSQELAEMTGLPVEAIEREARRLARTVRSSRAAVSITTDEPLAPGDERGTVASVSDGLALDAAMTRARRLRSSQQAKAGTGPRLKGGK